MLILNLDENGEKRSKYRKQNFMDVNDIILLHYEVFYVLDLPHAWPKELSFIAEAQYSPLDRGRPRKND
jgi:hypothetical protein